MGIRYIPMRPGIGLCNRRSPRNGSRMYVARRITPSTASEIVVIAATIVTPTKVLVTADAAMSAGSRGLPARGERLRAACWIRPPRRYRHAPILIPHSGRGIEEVCGDDPDLARYLRIEERELEAGGHLTYRTTVRSCEAVTNGGR